MSENLNLYKKMFAVMEESESLEKSMLVGSGKNSYKAISEAVVLNNVKPLLKKHKLILFPIAATLTENVHDYLDAYDSSKHKTRMISQVMASYKIVDIETGEFEILGTVGNGADPQDKGSGKAWTYAYKALLQKTFMLFSGEDTDNTHSDDVMPKQTGEQSENTDKKVTVAELQAAMKEKGITDKQIAATYKKETGKSCADLKFLPQEYKKKYFDMCQ